jgi:deazaflavin-dependent oxidoreductase (nitroreductase family)
MLGTSPTNRPGRSHARFLPSPNGTKLITSRLIIRLEANNGGQNELEPISGRIERAVWMPLPRWLAKVNKRVFNPLTMRRGKHPVLIHVGRKSGRTYRTPLDAHRLPDGYLFIPMYGPKTDWVNNVLTAGEARLDTEGQEINLIAPRMVRKGDVWSNLPPTRTPPGISDSSELLQMDIRH